MQVELDLKHIHSFAEEAKRDEDLLEDIIDEFVKNKKQNKAMILLNKRNNKITYTGFFKRIFESYCAVIGYKDIKYEDINNIKDLPWEFEFSDIGAMLLKESDNMLVEKKGKLINAALDCFDFKFHAEDYGVKRLIKIEDIRKKQMRQVKRDLNLIDEVFYMSENILEPEIRSIWNKVKDYTYSEQEKLLALDFSKAGPISKSALESLSYIFHHPWGRRCLIAFGVSGRGSLDNDDTRKRAWYHIKEGISEKNIISNIFSKSMEFLGVKEIDKYAREESHESLKKPLLLYEEANKNYLKPYKK